MSLTTTPEASMYEDQIDPYEAAMEMTVGLGMIDGFEDTDPEVAYWIEQQEAEIEAERRNEIALSGGDFHPEDDEERALWATDPQINGEGYEPYEPSPYAGDDSDLPF